MSEPSNPQNDEVAEPKANSFPTMNSPDKEELGNRDNYTFGKQIGQGPLGPVYEVTEKSSSKQFAIRQLSKAQIMRTKLIEYVKSEKDALSLLHHPNIIELNLVFPDPSNIYFVVELAKNGNLQTVLQEYKALDISCVRHIAAQVLNAMIEVHKARIIHQNIRPDNILLDSENRVKLSGFSMSTVFAQDQLIQIDRGCYYGSPEYLPPEILNNSLTNQSADLWSFGCLIYTLLLGHPPFHGETNEDTIKNITSVNLEFPDFIPAEAKNIIQALIKLNPSERLGYNTALDDYKAIRSHPFFSEIQWETISEASPPKWAAFEQAASLVKDVTAPVEEVQPEKENIPSIAIQEEFPTQVPSLLLTGEKSLFEGSVTKRVGLSVKKRRLVLTNGPRLFYAAVEKDPPSIKGEIKISREMKVSVLQKGKWTIEVPGRTYNLTSDEPEKWKEAIEKLVATL